LHTLEAIDAPYMIIGAFAATVYGITRVTYDIDIVVNLQEQHIQVLCKAYPLPRYYADPMQMRDSIRMGIMFNIIDTTRGEKADLVPLTLSPTYRLAFQRRVRQRIELPNAEEGYVDTQAAALGREVAALWQTIKEAAQREANRGIA
jgi:hypothetical protein